MNIFYVMAVTGFVTGLLALVGFVSDWWYNDRHWRRSMAGAERRHAEQLAETRQIMQTLEVQQQINKTMADDLAQLRTYRRHHSARLRDLEDVILRLNEDGSMVRYTFDGGHAVKITASIGCAAQPERSVGVRSHELEHTQPLPVVPPLALDWKYASREQLP